MPKFYSELQEAHLENLATEPTNLATGRIYRNTATGNAAMSDGTKYRSFLQNDEKCIIGNQGSPANNIRLHRGASAVLQLVTANDATAEGSLSTSLAQISGRAENYTDAGKPSAGNAGRIIYVTDQSTFKGDNGSSWVPLGAGGGGVDVEWFGSGSNPEPSEVIENGALLYKFIDGDTQQYLYAEIRIPDSYIATNQILLKGDWYTSVTSGTVKFQTVATLIRPGTDAADSTTNQHTSTTTAATVSGTANTVTSVSLDLSNASGEINSVAVSPGDRIRIQITRDVSTDTAAADAKLLKKGWEVVIA